jgi:hypothetical protein
VTRGKDEDRVLGVAQPEVSFAGVGKEDVKPGRVPDLYDLSL